MSTRVIRSKQVDIGKDFSPPLEKNYPFLWDLDSVFQKMRKREIESVLNCVWLMWCLWEEVQSQQRSCNQSILQLVLQLQDSRGMRRLTGQNGDADGHTLHLGPSPKVNNVLGAIW